MVLAQGSQGSKGLASTCAPKEPIICLLLFVHREDPLDRMRGMVTRSILPLPSLDPLDGDIHTSLPKNVLFLRAFVILSGASTSPVVATLVKPCCIVISCTCVNVELLRRCIALRKLPPVHRDECTG